MEYLKDLITGVNLGMYANDGIWIYYMESGDGNALYRIKTDGTCKTKMSGKSLGSHIKLEGEWLYYQAREEGTENYFFYRIRRNGTGEIKISDEKAFVEFVIKDGWIYFTEDKNLKKMRTDGTCITQLGSNHMGCLALKGQILYFGRIGFLGGLTKIGTDAQGRNYFHLFTLPDFQFLMIGYSILIMNLETSYGKCA
jgi:hypothetical protein